MDKDIKNKITLDMIKKMNENYNRPKRVYEQPIIEIQEEEQEEIKIEEPKRKPKKEIGILQLVFIHIILIVIILTFVALN